MSAPQHDAPDRDRDEPARRVDDQHDHDSDESAPVAVLRALAPSGTAAVRRATTSADPLGGTAVDPQIKAQLAQRRGRGESLPPDIVAATATATGVDVGGARMHRGAEADDLTARLAAQAFTVGNDIYLSSSHYQPGTTSAQRLLAHEVGHLTQGTSGPSSTMTVGHANDPAEADADVTAGRIVAALSTGTAAVVDTEPKVAVSTDALQRQAIRTSAPGDLDDLTIRRMPGFLKKLFGKAKKPVPKKVEATVDEMVKSVTQTPDPPDPTPKVDTPAPTPAPKTASEEFDEALGNKAAPASTAEGRVRMQALRLVIEQFSADERAAIWADATLKAEARVFVGDPEYPALVAALGMYEKHINSTGNDVSHHMTGAQADVLIKERYDKIADLKGYIEAAVAAGKKADGYVAVVGDSEWADLRSIQLGGGADSQPNAYVANQNADRPAILHAERGTKSTAIHESMHRYSVLNVLNTFGSPLNEGMTEFFTRLITAADGSEPGSGPERNNYDDNFGFVSAKLVPMLAAGTPTATGRVTLAEVYFGGKIDVLKAAFTAVCKAASLADDVIATRWNDFTTAVKASNWADAEKSWKP